MAKIQTDPDTARAPAAGAAPARAADDIPRAVQALADQLAATAVERDRQGGHAAAERERIRASGLLRLSVPTQHGGAGASWSTVLAAVRTLAEDVEEKLDAEGVPVRRHEGMNESRWVVLDYAHVIVHVFHPEERAYYNIERLWMDGSNQITFEAAQADA